MIQKRYTNQGTSKLQIRKELDCGTKLADTWAAKTPASNVAVTKLRVKHGEAIILGADQPNLMAFFARGSPANSAFHFPGLRALGWIASISRSGSIWLRVSADEIKKWWSGPPSIP